MGPVSVATLATLPNIDDIRESSIHDRHESEAAAWLANNLYELASLRSKILVVKEFLVVHSSEVKVYAIKMRHKVDGASQKANNQ